MSGTGPAPSDLGPRADHVRTMARYNTWMNERLYALAAGLSDAERTRDRGAFFKSIHGTLNHLMVGDLYWMGWFEGRPPDSSAVRLDGELYADFAALRAARAALDARIEAWAARMDEAALSGEISFESVTLKARRRLSMWHAAIHFFNHQTHHRGQLTTLLTQAGLEIGPTDLHRMPGVAVTV